MLRFSDQLTPAATAIFVMCLDLASDEVVDVDRPEAWREAYPLSATCFTPELARATPLGIPIRIPPISAFSLCGHAFDRSMTLDQLVHGPCKPSANHAYLR